MPLKKKKQLKKPSLQKILRLPFRNQKLLEAALTHPSFRNENPPVLLEDFDRLEFFGDAILNLTICKKLYGKYPEADEGLLSRLRSILVSRRILSRIAQGLKLTPHLRLGKSLKHQFRHSKAKILADSFEALLAAIYFDQGPARAEKFILDHFESYFDAKKLFRLDPNPKSTLQELTQKRWQQIPNYQSELTPHGTKTVVTVPGGRHASAIARTRQESEEKAARQLIRKIRQLEPGRRSKRKSSGKKLRKIF